MAKLRVPSNQMYADINAMRRKVLGVTRPQEPAQTSPGQSAGWYWGELLTAITAPTNGWTGPTTCYVKLMVPDASNSDDPQDFVELGTGAISAATNASPIVITSTAHGRREGDLIYVTGVLGNTAANGAFRVANPTANTFELLGSTGNGAYTSGGTWYAAEKVVNRDESLAGIAGVQCKIEHAWGEWSFTWVGC